MDFSEAQAQTGLAKQREFARMFGEAVAVSEPPPTSPGYFFRRGRSRLAIEVPAEIPEADFDVYREGALELRLLASNFLVFVLSHRFRFTDKATPWGYCTYTARRDRWHTKGDPWYVDDPALLPAEGRNLDVFLIKSGTHECLAVRRMLMSQGIAWSLDKRTADSGAASIRTEAQLDDLLRSAGSLTTNDDLELNPGRWPRHDPHLIASGYAVDQAAEAPIAG
jgi:hypothetical protein